MRTDDIKRAILTLFRRGKFYGYDAHKRLEQEVGEIELSRLYRVLNEMEEESLLESHWENSAVGPRKKMYTIGEEGRSELRKIFLEAIGTVHDFYGDYLISLYPKIKVFDEIFDWLTEGMRGYESVGYYVNSNSKMHEMVIRSLDQRIPRGKLYIILSKNFTRELNTESVTLLRGDYDNIPLKDKLLDMIVTVDLPGLDILEESIRELGRVLKDDGKLGLLTPSILLQTQEDPLTIGDFIEKNEHEVIERSQSLDKEHFGTILKTHFRRVKEKEIVHLTLLRAFDPIKRMD